MGIDICMGAALTGVRLLWTTSFSIKFSLFQLLQLFKQCWLYMVYHQNFFLEKNVYTAFPHIVSAETILFLIWKSKGHST